MSIEYKIYKGENIPENNTINGRTQMIDLWEYKDDYEIYDNYYYYIGIKGNIIVSYFVFRESGDNIELYKLVSEDTDIIESFKSQFPNKDIFLSIDLMDDVSKDDFNLDNDLLEDYSKLKFIISDVYIEEYTDKTTARLVLTLLNESLLLDRTIETSVLKEINITISKAMMKKTTTIKKLDNTFFAFVSIPSFTEGETFKSFKYIRDYYNSFIIRLNETLLNPAIFVALLNSCNKVNLVLKHGKTTQSKYFFYWFNYFKTNKDFVVRVDDEIYCINPLNNEVKDIYNKVILNNKDTKFILPLSIPPNPYLEIVNFLSNLSLNYKLINIYTNCSNLTFESLLFETDKYIEKPKISDETAKNIYIAYQEKNNGKNNVKYVINRSDLKYLRSLVNKPKEYGGMFKFIDNFNVKLLVSGGDFIEGEDETVIPPVSEINFHTHPSSCMRKYSAFLVWPSGPDFNAVTRYGPIEEKDFKTHLVITDYGIYFIKLNQQFKYLLSVLSKECILILLNLVYAFFAGWESLRLIDNLDKYDFTKDYKPDDVKAIKEDFKKDLGQSTSEACITKYSKVMELASVNYMNQINNNLRFSDLFKQDKYYYEIASQGLKNVIEESAVKYENEINNMPGCKKIIDEAKRTDFSIFVVTFARWDALLANSTYEFN